MSTGPPLLPMLLMSSGKRPRSSWENSLHTGLDKKYRHVWVLGKTAGNGTTTGTTSKNDEIKVFGSIFGMSSSVNHIADE